MGIKSVIVDGAEALKLMVDGKVAWERCVLPAGYQKCAFLQSDGNQYLSVDDYIPQIGDSLSIIFVRHRYYNFGTIFSAGTGEYKITSVFGDPDNRLYMRYFTNGDAPYKSHVEVREKPYNLRFFSDGKILFDGTEIDSEVEKSKEPVNTNLHLFIRANLQQGFAGKILGFQADRSGETIHNLVPALRSIDGKPGMIDTVSKKFYVNQGTGEFLYELA